MRCAFGAICRLTLLLPAALIDGQSSAQPGSAETSLIQRTSLGSVSYAWADLPPDYRLSLRAPVRASTSNLSRDVQCSGVAITGGYFRPDGRPAGLQVVKGKVVAPHNGRNDGGILTISSRGVFLDRVESGRHDDPAASLIYSQPILVYNNVVDGTFKKGRANRVALGRYNDGQIFMVMAYNNDRVGLSAISLTDFARDVLRFSQKRVQWLLNFDGGPSAFISESGSHPVLFTNGVVTSYICAEKTSGR